MHMQIAVLGRQPALSCAELEALYGADAITRVSDEAALVQSDTPLPQDQLGGTMKSALVLAQIQNTNLADIFSRLETIVPDLAAQLPEGKVHCGVSVYGEKAQKNWLL